MGERNNFSLARIESSLARPVDGASLAAFRVIFGLIMAAGAARYFAYDWVEKLFVSPGFHFHYWGFSWIPEPSEAGVVALVWTLLGSSLLVAAGLFSRLSALAAFLSFSYLELLDVTNYLNHHYLAALLMLLLAILPASRVFSLDALMAQKRGAEVSPFVPALSIALLRFQLLVVYFFAGVAKIGPDWLLHGQPLTLWLSPLADRPIIGPFLALSWAPLALSWAGCLYDLSIGFLLLNGRTRPWAYALVLVFHSLTRVFFSIGLFPWIMSSATLIFFSPSWPRWLLSRLQLRNALRVTPLPPPPQIAPPQRSFRPVLALTSLYAVVQLLIPLRAFAYPSDVLWAEDGMRFSWRVMIREKSASITYNVRAKNSSRRVLVSPLRYLNVHQEREMGGQPDMIAQLARHIGRDYEKKWGEPVAVYADAWVSFNGRKPAQFIDPTVDLASAIDDLSPAPFVLPPPKGPPAQFRKVSVSP